MRCDSYLTACDRLMVHNRANVRAVGAGMVPASRLTLAWRGGVSCYVAATASTVHESWGGSAECSPTRLQRSLFFTCLRVVQTRYRHARMREHSACCAASPESTALTRVRPIATGFRSCCWLGRHFPRGARMRCDIEHDSRDPGPGGAGGTTGLMSVAAVAGSQSGAESTTRGGAWIVGREQALVSLCLAVFGRPVAPPKTGSRVSSCRLG